MEEGDGPGKSALLQCCQDQQDHLHGKRHGRQLSIQCGGVGRWGVGRVRNLSKSRLD